MLPSQEKENKYNWQYYRIKSFTSRPQALNVESRDAVCHLLHFGPRNVLMRPSAQCYTRRIRSVKSYHMSRRLGRASELLWPGDGDIGRNFKRPVGELRINSEHDYSTVTLLVNIFS